MSRRRIAALSFVASLALGAVPSASADHHFIKLSEVYPGAAATPSNEFVELQMYADGQTLLSGTNDADVDVYDSGGSTVLDFDIQTDPPFGVNQRTILFGTATADAQFSVTSDYVIPAAGNFVNPAGGAVCFSSVVFGNIDCVSWGSFSNVFTLPVGSPASSGGIPDTQSIRRSLAPGCATLLEEGDDTNQSATDFAPGTPTPRANTTAPTETECVAPPPDPPTTPPVTVTPPVTTPAPTTPTVRCPKGKKLKKGKCVKKRKRKKSSEAGRDGGLSLPSRPSQE